MRKIGILLSMVLILNFHLFAQTVEKEEAETIAKIFLNMEDGKRLKNNLVVESQYTHTDQNGEALYHVFNFDNGGFVIVSGDKRTQPVLAYSTTNKFPIDNTNPAANFWVEHQYAKPINALKTDESIVATAEITQKWNEITSEKKQKSYADEVPYLLTSQWNQNKYYNTLCPDDDTEVAGTADYDFRVPNGCVALTMAQIMYYHRYPRQGDGEKRYRSSNYGYLSANFGETTYDYEAMSDVATDYSDAIARLIYHAGVAVSMGYAADGSGAQSDDVVTAFPSYFLYRTSNLLSKNNFSDEEWRDTIKYSLNAGLPVYYAAASSASGGADARHAFVCDGYDENDLFHFNWGWGGTADGYYTLGAMTPQNYKYDLENRIILNIRPLNDNDTNNFFSGTKTLTATYGSFNDGSGRFSYKDNTDCSWLISPQEGRFINSITLKVSTFSLGDGDSVYIYSGNSQSGTLVTTLTGEVVSGTYPIQNSEAFVVFKSDNDGIVGDGFTFTYTTSRQSSSYCATSTSPARMTSDSWNISSGNPDDIDYVSSNNCYWAIAPASAGEQVKLAFSEFDLNYGDFVEFYGFGTGSISGGSWRYATNGVRRFSKDNPPTLNQYYTIDRSTALVYFRTDNDLTASGFKIYWNVNDSGVSINEPVGNMTNLSVYPNPSTDYLMVDLTTSSDETIQLSLYDLLGKKVYSTTPVEVIGNYIEKIDVNNLAKGIYMLRVATITGNTTKKVVIK
jgi:hypothetical protein